MNAKKNVILAAMGLVLACGVATGASANSFDQTHPRRAEVNGRVVNENHRIVVARKAGEISKVKAMRMHARAHMIRVRERHMAARHGGHITKVQKARLNREENRLSRHIG